MALLLFALQPLSYVLYPRGNGVLLIPLMIVVGLAAAVASAQAFATRGLVAAGVSASATALFAWGNLNADAALDNLIGGDLPWWSEKVAATTIFLGIPAVLISAVLAFILTRRFRSFRES